jgi:hypothetical protein
MTVILSKDEQRGYVRMIFLWSVLPRSKDRYLNLEECIPQNHFLQLVLVAVIVRHPNAIY